MKFRALQHLLGSLCSVLQKRCILSLLIQGCGPSLLPTPCEDSGECTLGLFPFDPMLQRWRLHKAQGRVQHEWPYCHTLHITQKHILSHGMTLKWSNGRGVSISDRRLMQQCIQQKLDVYGVVNNNSREGNWQNGSLVCRMM